MRLQKQFISTFMCVASFDKNCLEGLGKFPNKRHLYYRCTACQFALESIKAAGNGLGYSF